MRTWGLRPTWIGRTPFASPTHVAAMIRRGQAVEPAAEAEVDAAA